MNPVNEVLVIDGVEDKQRKALFVTSALYHCADHLRTRVIRYVGVRATDVEIAARVLAFDTGLEVEISGSDPRAEPEQAFHNAALYAAVVLDNPAVLGLSQAADLGVQALIAIQFPTATHMTAEVFARLSAAHDPVIFARHLKQALSR
jgi:hypothetical protein